MSKIVRITCEYNDCTVVVTGARARRCVWLWRLWYSLSKHSEFFKLDLGPPSPADIAAETRLDELNRAFARGYALGLSTPIRQDGGNAS